MKRHNTRSRRLGSLAATATVIISATVFGFVTGTFADAPSYTWNGGGGDDNFDTGGNWVGGNAPAGGTLKDNLNFAGSTRLTPANNYPDYGAGYRIFFNSGAGVFAITGNHIRFYDVDGLSPQIQNDSSSLQTINFGFGVGSGSGGTMIAINPTSGDLAFGASSGNVFSYFDDQGIPLTIGGGNGHVVTFWGAINNGTASTRFVLAQNSIVVFKAANGYSGETDINAGELRIDTNGDITVSSGIYLGDGTTLATAQLTLLPATGGETWSRAFTVNPISSGVDYTKRTIAGSNTSGINTYSGDITLNGDVSLSAASGGTVTFSGKLFNNSSVRAAHATGPGTVVLGGTADNLNLAVVVDSGKVQLNKSVAGGTHAESGGLTVNSGGTAQLGPDSAGDEIYDSSDVTVNSGGVFDLNGKSETIRNFSLSGTGISSGGALINNNGSTTSTLTASGGTTLGAASSIGGSANITLPNAIGGPGFGITKIGHGTLTLSGANTYSGGTTIKAGQVTVIGTSSSTSGPLGPNTASVSLGDTTGGATAAFSDTYNANHTHSYLLAVQSGSSGVKTLSYSGTGSFALDGGITLNDSMTFACSSSGSINESGAVTGSGGVTVNSSGSGAVTLSKPSSGNTYAGNTTISQGTLKVGSATAIPNGSGKGIVTLNPTSPNTATFDLSGNNQTINGLSSSGTGSAVVDDVASTAQTLTVGTSGSNPSGTFAGVIQNSSTGTLGLTKDGSGTLTLSGANTYSGSTKVYGGTLKLQANNSLPVGTSVIIGTTSSSATLDLGGYNQQVAGLTTGGTASAQTIGNSSTSADSILTFNSSGSSSFGGVIKDSVNAGTRTVALIVSGGTLILTAANTYSGDTKITSGTIVVGGGGSDRLPTGTTVTLGSGSNSGLLQLGDSSSAHSQTLAGLVTSGTGTANAVVGGNSSTSTLTINNGASVTYAGRLGGDGANQNNLALTMAGTGTLNLGSANTYSSGTTLNAGTLAIGDDTALGTGTLTLAGGTIQCSGAARLVANATVLTTGNGIVGGSANFTFKSGGTFTSSGGSRMLTVNNFATTTLAGNVYLSDNNTAGSRTLTINGSGNVTVSAPVANNNAGNTLAAALTYSGSGALTLSGNNTYSGTTTISGGTLRINGQTSPNTGTGSGNVSVNAGGTLSGNGRIAGAVTVANYSTAVLYPNSSSTLSLGGNLTFSGSSSGVKFDLSSSASGANDKVVLENQTLACGSAQIRINSAGTLDSSDYVLFDVGASGNISGSFNSLPLFTGTSPKYSSSYTIVTVGKTVVLRYTPIAITVTAAANTKTYDGTTNASGVPTVTSGNLASGDTGTWTEAYNNKNVGAGNKTLTPAGTVKDSGNNDVTARYNITFSPISTGTINALAAQLSGTRAYNGRTTADYSILSVANAISPDTVNVASGSGTLASANAGLRAITSFDTLALGNNTAGNYTLNSASGFVTITQASTTNNVTALPNPSLPGANVTFTAAPGAVAPGAGTPTGTLNFKTNNVAFCDPITLDGNGVATLITNSFPHGATTLTAEYAGDSNFLGSTNSVVQVVNTPPSAGDLTLAVEKGGSATFPLAKYASDPDGDSLTPHFSGFNNGGSAAYADGIVTYTPANNFTGTETFNYTVTDPSGASSAPATVTATVSASSGSGANLLGIAKVGNTATITYAGIPGATYRLQYTLPDPISWQDVSGTSTTDVGGRGTLTDSGASDPIRWYRTKYVSGP